MTTYARLTTVDHTGRRQTGRYEILSEDAVWLLARAVDAEGADLSTYNAEGVLVDRQDLIMQECIVKRVELRMNNHYGTLEVAR